MYVCAAAIAAAEGTINIIMYYVVVCMFYVCMYHNRLDHHNCQINQATCLFACLVVCLDVVATYLSTGFCRLSYWLYCCMYVEL